MPRTKGPLNDRHKAILRFISLYIHINGFSPSLDEIADRIGSSSKSLVRFYLQRLEDEGYIRRKSNTARSITMVKTL